ncbi:MAG TPA: hypothetical protein VF652_07455, partial [Allosphingosinicella sp.]
LILTWTSDGGDSDGRSVRAQILGTQAAPPLANTAPVIISNGGAASVLLTHDEGVTGVATVVASDDGDVTALRYSISGGADAAMFTINAFTGALAFKAPPDHVQGGDNSYSVTVTASDGQLTDSQSFEISLRHVNYVTIVSDGGYDYASVSVDENQTAVTIVSAVDDDGLALTYAITGGEDSAAFRIDPNTGALRFAAAPDYEMPASAYHDNVYYVRVTASDGTRSDTQDIAVHVNDVEEPQGFAIVSDGGQDQAVVESAENGTAVTVVAAAGAAGPVTYEIAGGYDSNLFTIDSATGALTFIDSPDFEALQYDYSSHYHYHGGFEVVVRATDGVSVDEQQLKVVVANVDEAPMFRSYWGEAEVSLIIAENSLPTLAVYAQDPDGDWLTYQLEGADAALFEIDTYDGGLSLKQTLDYEAPIDSDRDNVYEVTVVAYAGSGVATQSFSIAIGNEHEPVTIISNGGSNSAIVLTPENRTAVTVVQAKGEGQVYYQIAGGIDASWFTINSYTGELSFRSPPNYESGRKEPGHGSVDHGTTYDVIVRASADGSYDDQILSVRVQNVDEAPVFSNYGGSASVALTMNENLLVVGPARAVDPERDIVTYRLTGPDSDLFLLDPATGALKFKQGPDFEAPADLDRDNVYQVTVVASSTTLSASQAFSVRIANVNESVAITSGGGGELASVTVAEKGIAVTSIAAADPDGDSITYAISGGADASRFAIDARTGALSFVQAADFEAPADSNRDNVYDVIVSASDGSFTDSQTLAVTVADVAEPVSIISNGGGAAASVEVVENGAAVTVVAAVDPDGATLSYAIAGGADSARFTIDAATGRLAFVAAPDFENPGDSGGDNVYDVIVSASDGSSTDSQSIAVTVVNVDEPVELLSYGGAGAVALTVQEGSLAAADVDARDAEDWPVTFSITGGADAALFRVDRYSGALAFAPGVYPDFEAPADSGGDNVYDVVVTASSSTSSAEQAFAITVADRNEALWITSDGGGDATVSVDEGGRNVTTVTAFDPDGDSPTYSILGGADAALFAIDPVTGALTFIAAPDHEAPGSSSGTNSYSVTVGASDGEFIGSQRIRVQVGNVNEGVSITSGTGAQSAAYSVAENGLAVTTVTAIDSDGDPLTYSIVGGADSSRFAIDPRTGALRFVEAPDFESPADSGRNNVYDVVVSVTDGAFTDSQAIAVTVSNVDEALAITSNGGGASASVTVAENGVAVARVAAADPDGGTVTYAIAGGADAARFRIDPASGALSFLSAPNFEAPADFGADNVYDVIVSASDGSFTDSQALAVKVGNVNEAPVVTSNGGGAAAAVSIAENSLAVTVVSAADPDGSTPTYSIVGGADAARFTINAQTGALSFVVEPDWELPGDSNQDNVYAVVVRASDGQLVDDQALDVTVTNIRDGNVVTATSGHDTISATSTNPALRTSNEEDLVFGRDGHDTLYGMAGDDEIYGEGGNDVLVGGNGADKLSGGLGKDEFTYNAVSESTAAARDLIADFSRSQGDKIVLSGIDSNSLVSGNQAFTFIGTSAFSNVAGQLRFETSAGITTIFGDVNGDGVADLQIQLSGSGPLIASDFVL